jgi:hypothetical protein
MDRSNKPRLKLTKTTVKILTTDDLPAAAGGSGLLCNIKTLICPTLPVHCIPITRLTICAC